MEVLKQLMCAKMEESRIKHEGGQFYEIILEEMFQA